MGIKAEQMTKNSVTNKLFSNDKLIKKAETMTENTFISHYRTGFKF